MWVELWRSSPLFYKNSSKLRNWIVIHTPQWLWNRVVTCYTNTPLIKHVCVTRENLIHKHPPYKICVYNFIFLCFFVKCQKINALKIPPSNFGDQFSGLAKSYFKVTSCMDYLHIIICVMPKDIFGADKSPFYPFSNKQQSTCIFNLRNGAWNALRLVYFFLINHSLIIRITPNGDFQLCVIDLRTWLPSSRPVMKREHSCTDWSLHL